jgi:hypothetical protein
MCFSDNVAYFRTYNIIFATIHVAFLVAACVTYLQYRDTWRPYYQIIVVHDQLLDVYPLLFSIVMHGAGTLFHCGFAWAARTIVEGTMSYRMTNSWKWVLQGVAEGVGLAGIMVIQGVAHLETVGATLLIWAGVMALCYFQDEYLNPAYDFMPNKEPHFFAIPIYVLLIVFVTIKSTEHVDENLNMRVAVASLVSLFQTSFMFVIQRIHVAHRGHRVVTAAPEGGDGDGDGDLAVPAGDGVRRAIFYEILHYANGTVFMMVVSWINISITREDVVLDKT